MRLAVTLQGFKSSFIGQFLAPDRARQITFRSALAKRFPAGIRGANRRWGCRMDFTGEERIAAPRDVVWAALNDPEIMRGCIPGCQSIERLSPGTFEAMIKVKFSLLSATFHGLLTLSNVHAPNSYTLSA